MEAYPLQWPSGYPRTPRPTRSRFSGTTFDKTRQEVVAEIRRLGGRNVIISTNLPLRQDGYPYASAKQPEDKGIAVYFTFKNNQVVFACDKWDRLTDNMKAIEKAVAAIRGLDRWGVSDMLNRAFTGFKALPGGSEPDKRSPWDVLGIWPGSSQELIRSQYLKMSKELHPDKPTGDKDKFQELQNAYEQIKQS